MTAILEMKNICKNFPGVKALDNVSFELWPGEIHALIGENGAGKSTLMKVLTGIYKQDSGSIFLKDKPFQAMNPKHAEQNGISMIYQEFNLLPHLTVAENIFVAKEPSKWGGLLIDEKKMVNESRN